MHNTLCLDAIVLRMLSASQLFLEFSCDFGMKGMLSLFVNNENIYSQRMLILRMLEKYLTAYNSILAIIDANTYITYMIESFNY